MGRIGGMKGQERKKVLGDKKKPTHFYFVHHKSHTK
jgi:hypothetical protein